MKTPFIIICLVFVAFTGYGQKFAVKTNVLYDATATVNLGLETALGKNFTLDVSGNYNGWELGDARWKHWMVQPEFRVWLCEKFNGHFFGLHGHAGEYNVGGFDPFGFDSTLKNKRHQGSFWGAGISYGYQWVLSDRWNFELTAGAGFARLNDRQYPLDECGELVRRKKHTYWGPTKLGVTFIFMIK